MTATRRAGRPSAKEIAAAVMNEKKCACGSKKNSCKCCFIFCHRCTTQLSTDIWYGLRGGDGWTSWLRFYRRAQNCLQTKGLIPKEGA